MTKIRSISLLWLVFFLASCVTINVYFPAAAAEKAADRIIEQVLGDDARDAEASPASGDSSLNFSIELSPVQVAAVILNAMVSSAHAEANIDISSPAINQLKSSMQTRHSKLSPFYKAGAIGFGADGLVVIRDASAVGLKERGKLKQLVAKENRDRNALYKELARANGHPEWEAQIRDTFARRWIAKAPRGWYYQASGSWRKK